MTEFVADVNGRKISCSYKPKELVNTELKAESGNNLPCFLIQTEAGNAVFSHTGKPFSTSLGSFPPNSSATIEITYVTELHYNSSDALYFKLLDDHYELTKHTPAVTLEITIGTNYN